MTRRHRFRVVSLLLLVVAVSVPLAQIVTARRFIPGDKARPAVPSERVTVQASGRGFPSTNLSDGRELITSYSGPPRLQRAMELNQVRGSSLASGDFDEDGVPDLVCGFAGPGFGMIAVYRGNIDSIYPNSPEAQSRKAQGAYTDAAFLSPARLFDLPAAADFLGVGDFDADSHLDVATATLLECELQLLRGDGYGGFEPVERIALPEVVTAMLTGDVNRRDGLADLVVGVGGAGGPRVLVFEGPVGALRSEPESFALPAEATGLALGQIDGEFPIDLAVATGRELLVVHGRDRELSLDVARRAAVPEAIVSRCVFPVTIRSVAVGDFDGDREADVAVLSDEGAVCVLEDKGRKQGSRNKVEWSGRWQRRVLTAGSWSHSAQLIRARVSSQAMDTLILVDSSTDRLEILNPLFVGPRRSIPNAQTVLLEVEGEAVAVLPMRLNSDALSDLVILRTGQTRPTVVSTIPLATFIVTSDADAGSGSLRDAITLANASAGADMISFNIQGVGPHSIKPRSPLPEITESVTIDGTNQPGFAGLPVIELNGARLGPTDAGLLISGGNSTIRGLGVNRASFNIEMTGNGGNVIEGNLVGIDLTGTAAAGAQGDGVKSLNSSGNRIGGTTVQARNIISGNDDGVVIRRASDNIVSGNFIGTNRNGNTPVGNLSNGVDLGETVNTVIGGTAAGAGNLVSGNGDGMTVSEGRGTLIQGNLIGTDATGGNALGNSGSGVALIQTSDTIGGTTVAARNIVSANGKLGSGSKGIGIFGDDPTRPAGNTIQGNYIGTDATGTRALGNQGDGVGIRDLIDSVIGGAIESAHNVISGNAGDGVGIGVRLNGRTGGTNILVQGNFIGTDASGTAPLGNENGVFVEADSITNTIEGNRIAFNRANGIVIPNNNNPGVKIAMVSNSIHSNELLGIDLGPPGVTENDELDGDPGANELQNFPELNRASAFIAATAIRLAAVATVEGTLRSKPDTTYTVEFFFGTQCSSSGSQSIGEVPVPLKPLLRLTTDSNGRAPFTYSFEFPGGRRSGVVICLATDPLGNTSEESPCIAVGEARCPPLVSPLTRAFTAAGGLDTANVFATAGCEWTASSANPDWIRITSGSSGIGPGLVTYSVAGNPSSAPRTGAMTIGGQTLTVTQDGKSPVIADAVRDRKRLIVSGEGFEVGATILLNGVEQRTMNDPEAPTTRLIAPKGGKRINSGDRVQVRNPDGSLSREFVYRGT